ncbi:hypothetical protein BU23DRAFT_235586 [Bimuria novae-zelandiae CBS 107.79]|uniref:Uncharacterized protein n=1 Tax=Bimuria novae-zelandiae CBS 107.79 TaxID=1447943 RepID=A0A6A5UYF0_9PLEO|nr:hypothetical protein BU23DRAFT_235586 [Bimuria novae-zelandiae CBS 107.79]
MFASLLRTRKHDGPETAPLLQALNRFRRRGGDDDDDDEEHSSVDENVAQYDGGDEDYERDEDDDHGRRDGPLLPVFSSELLDRIPIYNTTHSIRILVIQRCETTLSWDQLRSPQVSQFLVKPIQQQILASHFSRGAIYCLLSNCLQFRKEAEANPGNIGVNKSRALICELLAMRLLKEHSTRELIDALSYDFNPLQGLVSPGTATPGGVWAVQSARSARTSTIEVAIRAQAKKFLAHPLVVQQLEAIWAGTVVFHSVADSLHRKPEPLKRDYRTFDETTARPGPSRRISPNKQPNARAQEPIADLTRKTVTLYDPHDASLFKLSRLRVPRYRNLFSTLSYGIMLGLFLAVLAEKNDDITGLEMLFWVWSSGYMLDEIVGFSEQGFGLYIMSVWNAFDLGILLMFLLYYVLRLMGLLMPDVHSRHDMARLAYDVLGSTAILLFPRLFSALDHYRYFSQLLIAFRMMAMDLAAILILIIISCSGFFVAFTLAFKKDLGPADTAYALFQLLMGFTPAAWDIWVDANILGKTLLAVFLFICHFLIVTILVTVLTNSFMAVVQNANEEHQFLFAVNTISMVKSDALFSYIAPTNLVGWLLIPLKYFMPLKAFVRMNRLLIKITHIPILFSIFCYERILLSNLAYGPTDLVEQRGRSHAHAAVPAFSVRGPMDIFSPGNRLREPSITTFHKDRALEEVFRRPFRDPSGRTPSNAYPPGRRNSSNVVSDWMKRMGTEGGDAVPPQDDARSLLDRLETRKRPMLRRTKTTAGAPQRRTKYSLPSTRAASDPDDIASPFTRPIMEEEEPEGPQQTEDDGDDELLTNDEEERSERTTKNNKTASKDVRHSTPNNEAETSDEEYFRTPMTIKPRTPVSRTPARVASPTSSSVNLLSEVSPSKRRGRNKPTHSRNLSTNTVLFSPTKDGADETSQSSDHPPPRTATRSGTATPGRAPTRSGTTTPGRMQVLNAPPASRPRPIMPPAQLSRQNPNIANFISLNQRQREPSFNAVALDLASDIGDNRPQVGGFGGLPASFSTQIEMAARMKDRDKVGSEEDKRISRIIMSRMTNLEEGFRDVLKEVKGLKKSTTGSDGTRSPPSELAKKKGKGKKKVELRAEADEPRMGSSL